MAELESEPQPEEIEVPGDEENLVVEDALETSMSPETVEAPESPETAEMPAPPEESPPAALTINLYSWMTPIVGILMLIAGLLLGYFGRPLVANLGANGTQQAAAPTGTAVAGSVAPQPTSPQTLDEPTKAQLMEYLTSQVRHFKGDENAPITMIEFSDFQ